MQVKLQVVTLNKLERRFVLRFCVGVLEGVGSWLPAELVPSVALALAIPGSFAEAMAIGCSW